MTKTRSTKRALLLSALSLLLCMSMLIGSTFAWFTDSVTSANNKIVAGNLDVDLLMGTAADTYTSIADVDAAIFGANSLVAQNDPTDTLWEPGKTQIVYLAVENKGNLDLKYNIVLNVTDGGLIGSLEYAIVDGAKFGTINATSWEEVKAISNVQTGDVVAGTTVAAPNGAITAAEKTEYFALAVHMKEEAGNQYQGKDITIDVTVLATQLASEKDSFDDQYDKDATFVYPVSNTTELLEKLAESSYGDSFLLKEGEYELPSTLSIPSGVSLYGEQAGKAASTWVNDPNAKKTVISFNGTGNVLQILQTSDNEDEAVSNITIDGIMIDCNGTADKGISVKKTGGEAIEGVEIVNCAVIDSTNDGIDVQGAYGAVIKNNYVKNVVDTAIRLGNYNGYHYVTWAEKTSYVCDNVIENVTGSGNGAIMIENGMGDVVVSGNSITNVTATGSSGSSLDKASAITIYDVYEGGKILVENNNIVNADQGIAVYKYTSGTYYGEDWWEGPTTDNDGVTIKGNTIKDFTTFGIITTNLNEEKADQDAFVEIVDNEIISATTARALDVVDNNSGWTVKATGNTLNGVESAEVNCEISK